jgi:hypothetical protein
VEPHRRGPFPSHASPLLELPSLGRLSCTAMVLPEPCLPIAGAAVARPCCRITAAGRTVATGASCTMPAGRPRVMGCYHRCGPHPAWLWAMRALCKQAVSGFGPLAVELFFYFPNIFKFLQIQKIV